LDERHAWDRMDGEPTRWYHMFLKYYIGDGFERSVTRAYLHFIEENRPAEYEAAKRTSRGAPAQWYAMSATWNWRGRADAWETHQTDLSLAVVEEASRKLRLLTIEAVDTLALFMGRDHRLAVAAAKEVLDRGGLPATVRQEVAGSVAFTADDMAKAKEDVEEWEQKILGQNG